MAKQSVEKWVALTVVDLVVHLEHEKADSSDGIEVASKDTPTAAWREQHWASSKEKE